MSYVQAGAAFPPLGQRSTEAAEVRTHSCWNWGGVEEKGLTQGPLPLPPNILGQFSEPQSFSL